jgi:tetratricopeptide (TPR) repeat protein|tara:strand:+ start:1551 stop:3776 length:2226 start_codon:yes stop_codon:yes gene_type:complete
MKHIQKIICIAVFFTMVFACSTKKDSVINRNYHALTTKFNVLFNGKEAFKIGLKAINETYEDNFWKQLPIEPLAFKEEILFTEKSNKGPFSGFDAAPTKKETVKATSPFDRAEEKAVKAIQKHSMNIVEKERNRQIDDAYLLLGKARYYSQRFIPAIEAFNYVIENYPDASLINETKIWRAKANIRLDNERFAIESLKYLLVIKDTLEADLPNEIRERGYTALAMAYVQTDSLQKAKESLINATRTNDNFVQAARNLFVLGQMYASENKKDSATTAFKRIVNFRKAPYKFKIHAQIEIAKNFPKDSSSVALHKTLQKLIKNRNNRSYLDALYYQVGVLEENKDSTFWAVENYNKSLRAKNAKPTQKTYTYERLGNLYFKNNEFQLASAYYDSVFQVAENKNELRIRRVKRKFKNLASLIAFENTVKTNDSILKLEAMPVEAQEGYFQEYVDTLKKKDEAIAQQKLNQLAFGNSFGSSLQSISKGGWYFYNGQSLSFGKTTFQKTWNNRALEDNWRWASKRAMSTSATTALKEAVASKRYDVPSYIATIPTDEIIIDSLKIYRNQGLYELGLIYKQQFVNLPLSIEKLERLLTLQPKENKLLSIYYNLYQIYTTVKNKPKAAFFKNKILTAYADTKFAQMIQFPNKKLTTEKSLSETEKTYKEMYYLYKEGVFEEVVQKIDEMLPKIQNSILIPKFELLKAYCLGKYMEKATYLKAMEFVALSYGNSEEGKKAKEIVAQLRN